LRLEGAGDGFTVLDADGDIFQLRAEVRQLLAAGEQLQGAEDGQAGADEGEELLVEDEEGLKVHLLGLAGAGEQAACLDGLDVVSGLGEACAQLLFGGGGEGLLLHAPTFIGEPDYEFGHAWGTLWNGKKTASILDGRAWESSTHRARTGAYLRHGHSCDPIRGANRVAGRELRCGVGSVV
jgi:hypothetical protein